MMKGAMESIQKFPLWVKLVLVFICAGIVWNTIRTELLLSQLSQRHMISLGKTPAAKTDEICDAMEKNSNLLSTKMSECSDKISTLLTSLSVRSESTTSLAGESSMTKTAMKAVASSRKVFKEALALRQEGQPDKAVYYFMNAMSKDPGNLEILQAYSENVEEIAERSADNKRISEAIDILSELRSFLRVRSQFLNTQDIETLLILIDSIGQKQQELMVAQGIGYASSTGTTSINEETKTDYDELLSGELELSGLPNDIDSLVILKKRMQRLTEYVDLIEDNTTIPEDKKKALYDYLERLKRFEAAERAMSQAKKWLLRAKKAEDEGKLKIAAYNLQICEGTIRNIIAINGTEYRGFTVQLTSLLKSLDQQSQSVSNKSNLKLSKEAWIDFANRERISDKLVSYKKIAAGNGKLQKGIDDLTEMLKKFQPIMGNINHPEVAAQVTETLSEIRKVLEYMRVKQQHAYAKWAMKQLKKGFSVGLRYMSKSGDDEKKISDALTKYLGPIDTRLLPMEVSSSYSQVYQVLFDELNGPTSSQDFRTHGYKLDALRVMLHKKKKKISDF